VKIPYGELILNLALLVPGDTLIIRSEGFLNFLAVDVITNPKLPPAPVKMGHDNLPFCFLNLNPVYQRLSLC
jgi:hypothetical protein